MCNCGTVSGIGKPSIGSGSVFRKTKLTLKNRKKVRKFDNFK
jgi:hypothetical protein